jgi:hypothetical protein
LAWKTQPHVFQERLAALPFCQDHRNGNNREIADHSRIAQDGSMLVAAEQDPPLWSIDARLAIELSTRDYDHERPY